jgi:ABC-type multidrug transport system fused ATPase/permease subunit
MTDIERKMAANIGGVFVPPTKDGQQRLVAVEADAELAEKLAQARINDEGRDDMIAEVKARFAKESYFSRIYAINRGDRGLVAVAFAGCVISGVVQPIFGILFSELIFYTTENRAIFGVDYEESVAGEENLLCGDVALIALALFLAIGLRFYAFGRLAMQVTHAMRQGLYRSILHKDQSFFEHPKYDVEYLTSVLQDDTEVLNGTSIEKLGPWVEGTVAVIGAIVISAVFCWQQMIVCVLCLPVLVVCSRTMWRY